MNGLCFYFQPAGNQKVTFYELSSIYGHDTFLLDVNNVGVAMKASAGLGYRVICVLLFYCIVL